MKNKYQEALDRLCKVKIYQKEASAYDYLGKEIYKEEINILQELVDEKIPVKPTVKELKRPDGKGGKEFWQYLYECPKCEENYKKNRFINHFNSLDKGIPYCKHCGQRLDWSDDKDE